MGLLTKKENASDDFSLFSTYFDVPKLEEEKNAYLEKKQKIKALSIDIEEKNNILNKINTLTTIINPKEKKKAETCIEDFCKKYHI